VEVRQYRPVIHVGGAPIPLSADLSVDTGIHILSVPIDQTLFSQTYPLAEFTHEKYLLLIPEGALVPTITVGDVMAVHG
jgi:hypothetical protein